MSDRDGQEDKAVEKRGKDEVSEDKEGDENERFWHAAARKEDGESKKEYEDEESEGEEDEVSEEDEEEEDDDKKEEDEASDENKSEEGFLFVPEYKVFFVNANGFRNLDEENSEERWKAFLEKVKDVGAVAVVFCENTISDKCIKKVCSFMNEVDSGNVWDFRVSDRPKKK